MKPDDWVVRDQIALALSDRGDWAAAVEEQRESVRRFPGLAVVHKALAHALEGPGALDDAIAEFREAVRLEPRFPPAYLYLGRALIEAGEYRAALEALARVDPGPPPADPILSPSTLASRAEHLHRARAAAARRREGMRPPRRRGSDARISPGSPSPGTLRGGGPPVGRRVRRLADAGGRPDHGEPLPGRTGRGAGRCRGRPPADRRRPLPGAMAEQAVAWLEADLTASAAVLESGTSRQRAAVLKRLGRWQVDPALAGLRDEPAMAGIPEPERRSLRDLWRRIDAMRARALAPASPAHGASRNP